MVARSILIAALEALEAAGARAKILVSPAGFIDVKRGSTWTGSAGWATPAADFATIAAIAEESARELVSSDVRSLAHGNVAHLVLGIDVWPTGGGELHGEVACHADIDSGAVQAVTGKTYPTGAQEAHLIREADASSHTVDLDDQRLAILVCHDLAAWSPTWERRGDRDAAGGLAGHAGRHRVGSPDARGAPRPYRGHPADLGGCMVAVRRTIGWRPSQRNDGYAPR